jgi:hypothetical protein
MFSVMLELNFLGINSNNFILYKVKLSIMQFPAGYGGEIIKKNSNSAVMQNISGLNEISRALITNRTAVLFHVTFHM